MLTAKHTADPSTFEALWPSDLFIQGIGWVILARFKPNGRRVEAGVFLVDVFCLGVKLAVFEACEPADYQQRIRNYYVDEFPMVATEPCAARKLLEQAVEYAGRIGFAPHPDYRKAMRPFQGLQAAQSSQEFAFGYRGKPFYRRGPRETDAQARQIVSRLQQRCGPGNFDYLVMLGDAADISRAFEQ
jgi:hypothetical protein